MHNDDEEAGAPPVQSGEDFPAIEPKGSPLLTTGAAPAPETAKAEAVETGETAPVEKLLPVEGLTRGGIPEPERVPEPLPAPTKAAKADKTILCRITWQDGMEGPNGTVLMPGAEVWLTPEAARMHALAGKVEILKDKG